MIDELRALNYKLAEHGIKAPALVFSTLDDALLFQEALIHEHILMPAASAPSGSVMGFEIRWSDQ